MTLSLIVSAVLLAQAAPVVADEGLSQGQADAAYEQLAAGQTEDAIVQLEASLERTPDYPSVLINLGTAYVRANRIAEAREAFRRAIASDERYSVELADGSWEDSRKVARLALASLDRTTALATK